MLLCKVIFAAGFLLLGPVPVLSDLSCPSKFGYFPDPTDCAGYFICTFGNAKTRKCGNGLQYKTITQTCDVAKPDNCEQDGGQANRPKYTGPTMQQSSAGQQSAAAATNPPAADDQVTPSATTASFPFETAQITSKPGYFSVGSDSAPDQSGATSSRRSSLLDQYINKPTPRSSITTKRNYDYWKDSGAPATGAPPTLKKPQQSNKPFRDADYVAGIAKSRNPSPTLKSKPKLSAQTTTSAPDTYQDNGQNYDPSNQLSQGPDDIRQPSTGLTGPQKGSFGTRPDTQQQSPPPRQGPGVPKFQFPQQSQGLSSADDGSSDQNQPSDQQMSWNQNGNTWPAPLNSDQGYMNAASQSQGLPADGSQQSTVGKSSDNIPADGKSERRSFPRPSVLIPTDSALSQCTAEKCQLPNCYCGSTAVPGGLSLADAPQMIVLSFDAEINERNLPIYERLFHKNRKNQNGCNVKGTFFVSHEFTNYGMVRYLYEKGHEIASHSITHGVGTGFKDEKSWETEMSGEKSFLASFASIRPDDIKGARAPLLGPGGDDQFQALLNGGFLYDSTLVTPTSSKAPYWPYTMDFAMPHTCVTPPCPVRGYKGIWELPLNPIYGLFGESCYEADRCTFGSTGDDVYKLLYSNFFDHHYSTNKAPFHLAIHADWLKYPPHREAFERFLDVVGAMPDVYVVTGSQVVAWMQQPTPVSQLTTFQPWLCSADDASRLPQCDTINACPLNFHDRLRYFYTCSECPNEFPWRPEQ